MEERERRIGVVGATGALGAEVLAILEERRFPVAELRVFASERSLGEEIECMGESVKVEVGDPRLAGLDLVFLCAPPSVSLEAARHALKAEVPCIDLSGVLAARDEVPLVADGSEGIAVGSAHPLIAVPAGAGVAWYRVLKPLHEAAGLTRAVATQLVPASSGGRDGIEALRAETVALFGQQDSPEPAYFGAAVAFDCLPWVDEVGEGGFSAQEAALMRDLRRLLGGAELSLVVAAVRVPTFCGEGAVFFVETERELSPEQAVELFQRAPGVCYWGGPTAGPTTRESAGRDVVLVGRVRRDPSARQGLCLWLAADVLRIAATSGVQLAERWLLHN